ncbi:MAG: 23S rRNA pseudouridine2605 synthase [Candidatus Krumholzibacteriia bacterium]|jgi:23S rRNA pseudouridine2605 synthase
MTDSDDKTASDGKDPAFAPSRWHLKRAMGLGRALVKASYGTRRQTDTLVIDGHVRIGDKIITDPKHMVSPQDDIYLDGELLKTVATRYFAIHKPLWMQSGEIEGAGRKKIDELFPGSVTGLVAAGRMDTQTSGLVLVSNDSEWNNLITTSIGLEQEYRVQVMGELSTLEIKVMTAGATLPNLGVVKPKSVRIIEVFEGQSVISLTIGDGKIREVRKMLQSLRHQVKTVRRVRIGDIRISQLPAGGRRELSQPEVASIRTISAALRRSAGS